MPTTGTVPRSEWGPHVPGRLEARMHACFHRLRFLGYCTALGFVATVLTLGLWGTLGTLAVTNAQSEVQWIAASCEILSGNMTQVMTQHQSAGGGIY